MADADRKTFIEFRRSDPSEVIDAIEALAERRDGSWVNIEAIIDEIDLDEIKAPNPLLRLFSSQGPMIPFGTYIAATDKGERRVPPQVGLQHGAGQKAMLQLAELGVRPRDGWVVLDDSPKRGMVFRVPDDDPVGDVVEWILVAATALSQVRIREHWSAVTFRSI